MIIVWGPRPVLADSITELYWASTPLGTPPVSTVAAQVLIPGGAVWGPRPRILDSQSIFYWSATPVHGSSVAPTAPTGNLWPWIRRRRR